MKRIIIFFLLFLGIVFYHSIPAGDSTLFLEDWGVVPGIWTPTSAPADIRWVVEDFTGNNPGVVGPGWGGQPFDAEAAYIAIAGSNIYLAVVTGLPPQGIKDPWRFDNPTYTTHDWNRGLEKYWYDPGDIGIDIGGDGSYEFAITTRINNMNSSYAPTPGAGVLVSGNLVWENPRAWGTETYYTDWNGVSDPWAVVGYDHALYLGTNFSYTVFGNGHYAIEAIINNSLLGLNAGDILTLHWTMECGNDSITLSNPIEKSIPEPSTFLLLGTGITSLFLFLHKKKT